jgi:signal peptide peptidase SppA
MLMVFDSPGGSVQGLTNTAQKIRNMNTPTVSFAQGMMASAAYFIGSAADQVIASPDSLVGSIGSVVMLKSYHDKLKEEGIDVKIVRSSKYKAKPHPAEPNSEDSVKETQRIVDAAYNQFVSQLSINLALPEQEIKNTMADGKIISGKDADSTNYADSVKTLDEVMASFEQPEDSEGGNEAFQFLQNQYQDLRQRHSSAIDHIRSLESRIEEMEDDKREQEIENLVQAAIYEDKKIAPGKEDKLRAQLSDSFESTKAALELMDEGSAGPSSPVEGDTNRDDDPATQSEAVSALRANGFKVAPDDEAAQMFERFGQDYVKQEDAVDVAREHDLL